jgi:hypothetical protein
VASSRLLRNVSKFILDNTASHPRRGQPSWPLSWISRLLKKQNPFRNIKIKTRNKQNRRASIRKRCKVKVKCTFVQALRLCTTRTAHRGSRGIALLFHDHDTRGGWGVSLTPRPIFAPGKTRYPLYRRLGGPQGRSGQVRKISPPPRFNPRTVQPVASRYTDWAIPAHT